MHSFRTKKLLISFLCNAGLTVLSIAITLLALEFGIRGYYAFLDFMYPGESASAQIYMYDPVRGWKLKPNSRGVFSQQLDRIRTTIAVNSSGLRGKERLYEKKDRIKRICMIGNSAIAGFEVDEAHLLSTKLEQMLNAGTKRASSASLEKIDRYEVLNFGVRGYGTDQSYLTLLSEAARYKPDIVIYVFSGNDFNDNITIRNPNRIYAKSYFALNDSGTISLRGVPVPIRFPDSSRYITVFNVNEPPQRADRNIPAQDTGVPGRKASFFKSLKNDLAHSTLYCLARKAVRENPWLTRSLNWTHALDNEWKGAINKTSETEQKALTMEGTIQYKTRLLGGLLNAMHYSVDSLKAKLLVYEMSNGSGEQPQMPTMLNRLCDSCQIPYISSIPEFFEKAKGSKSYSFEHDGHWNNKGHALAAKILYDYLIANRYVENGNEK